MQNAKYVAQRNALIPAAVRHANKAAGANPQSSAGRYAWNKAFHAKMNELSTIKAAYTKRDKLI